ncbi:MAG: sulfurtransferase [Cytophagaceae bacterium]|nr:sulfurtransferase [Cytophagaceae bacterium]
MILPNQPIVDISWLSENFGNPLLKIIESKLKPIGANHDWESGQKNPGAVLLDIEEDFSDKKSDLPHTLPNEEDFSAAARKLGINQDDILVIYDQVGVYSSPRAWWMFKVMGHKNVFVLDGGLPAWRNAGHNTEEATWEQVRNGNFKASFQSDLFFDTQNILDNLENKEIQILDARSEGRFNGTAPEPRAGMRGGHMPNAGNIPFDQVLNGHYLKSPEDLKIIFDNKSKENQKLVMTCGSGVTASILALAATISGRKDVAVYDGSWSEWGRPGDLPVVIS